MAGDNIVDFLKEDIEKLEKKVEDGFRDLNTKIDVFMANYVHKEEFNERIFEIKKEAEKLEIAINDRIAKIEKDKVDKEIFDPIQKTLSRLNWIVIGAVVAGLLALIMK